MSGAKIYSTALGVAVLGGNFTTEGTSSVTATRATGVYVQGGTVTNSGTLDVTSTISSSWENEGADFDNTSFKTSRFNGIFVNGGSLNSTGMLNVTFTGVASDENAEKGYSSYAVSVESGDVTLGSGAIAGNSAGGIYVSDGELTAGAVTVSAGGTVQNDNFIAEASTYASGVLVKTGTVIERRENLFDGARGGGAGRQFHDGRHIFRHGDARHGHLCARRHRDEQRHARRDERPLR